MRSKCSPATGSNQLPWRKSTFFAPVVAIVACANASARSWTSVATIFSALPSCPSNCTPEPVPKSSTECTGVVGVVRSRDRLAAPTPRTWLGPGTWSTTDASTSENTQRLVPSIMWERISKAMRITPLESARAMLASTSFVARTEPTAAAKSVAGAG